MARKPKEKDKGKLPSGNVRVQVYSGTSVLVYG